MASLDEDVKIYSQMDGRPLAFRQKRTADLGDCFMPGKIGEGVFCCQLLFELGYLPVRVRHTTAELHFQTTPDELQLLNEHKFLRFVCAHSRALFLSALGVLGSGVGSSLFQGILSVRNQSPRLASGT